MIFDSFAGDFSDVRNIIKTADMEYNLNVSQVLDVLERYCMAEGLEYRRLDGSTKSKDRIHIVKEFNTTSNTNICLVSTM